MKLGENQSRTMLKTAVILERAYPPSKIARSARHAKKDDFPERNACDAAIKLQDII